MAPAAATDLKPSAMRGNEYRYGLLVAAELVVVAILNLSVTHGKGAPAHPPTTLALIGLVAALAVFGLLRTDNRMIVGFGSIIAAFFVTLPRTPNSLSIAHLFALGIPLAYTLVLTQRQRKATTTQLRQNRAAGPRPAAGRAGRRRKEPQQPEGPRPSRRYTPPKSKRPTGKGSGRR